MYVCIVKIKTYVQYIVLIIYDNYIFMCTSKYIFSTEFKFENGIICVRGHSFLRCVGVALRYALPAEACPPATQCCSPDETNGPLILIVGQAARPE